MKRILIVWFFAAALGSTCYWAEYGPFDDQGKCEKARAAWVVMATSDGSQEARAEFCIDR